MGSSHSDQRGKVHPVTGGGQSAAPERILPLNRPPEVPINPEFAANAVSTSKYTVLSFVPKNLFEFFRVVANCYFLLISVLQVGTNLSPTNPYTTITPLTVVLIITMIKQGIEDFKRHVADHVMNNRSTNVIRQGKLQCVSWKDVETGDLLLVHDREELPADIVILSTSEELGKCFIETANLDGETNLKRREVVKPVAEIVGLRAAGGHFLDFATVLPEVSKLRGDLHYEAPNNSLYTFVGTLSLQNSQSPVPVGPQNIILRGCMLRSCKWVVGLVIFTGKDTKLMQNQRPTPSKQSNVYKMVNRCIFLIFVTQFVLCVVSSVLFGVWSEAEVARFRWYLGAIAKDVDISDIVVSFFTFLILYNNLVPISLYVSLDMIKVTQAKMIEKDESMKFVTDDGEQKYAKARTSDLNEDLGQIEYVFSDKTGTLTRNMMEFRKCSIGGVAYGFGTTEIGAAAQARSGGSSSIPVAGILPKDEQDQLANMKTAQVHLDPKIHFDDPRLLEALRAGGPQAELIHEFLVVLSVCHTVIPEIDDKTGEKVYRASSPDEEALVKAARVLGYDFTTPAPVVSLTIATGPSPCRAQYEILNVNEFNSTRKRQSVVVKTPDGALVLYCKGADNIMFERCGSAEKDKSLLLEHLKCFASEGLRTLVLARRELSSQEYNDWNRMYQEAATSMSDRAQKLEDVAELIETNMDLIGATAIEDKLQEGVPDAVASLSAAGIKVWVLTGDKEETAINIGFACRLLHDKMKLLKVNQHSREAIVDQLSLMEKDPDVLAAIEASQCSDKLALIVDGPALLYIMKSDSKVKGKASTLAKTLLSIARCCKAVVACRVSPSQKAAIVRLVRCNVVPEPITLAIGDGANDVNMIQTAHVGVGISGQEGVQAVNSSDYAIAQFKFLQPLLLVHGRLNYKRVAKVILYSFYKNIALVLTLFLYNFYNGYSGTTLFESFVMAGWNFFLALPIIAIGVQDTDVSSEMAMSFPQLYGSGQWNLDLNPKTFLKWILNAFGHAVIVFYFCYTFKGQSWSSRGLSDDLDVFGVTVYTCLLLTMNYKVMTLAQLWTRTFKNFLFGSILLYFAFLCLYNVVSFMANPRFYFTAFNMFMRPGYWLLVLLVPVACMVPDVTATAWFAITKPSPGRVLREMEHMRSYRYHPEAHDGEKSSPSSQDRPSPTGGGFHLRETDSGIPGMHSVYSVNMKRGSVISVAANGVKKSVPSIVKQVQMGANSVESSARNLFKQQPHTGFDYNAPTCESHFATTSRGPSGMLSPMSP